MKSALFLCTGLAVCLWGCSGERQDPPPPRGAPGPAGSPPVAAPGASDDKAAQEAGELDEEAAEDDGEDDEADGEPEMSDARPPGASPGPGQANAPGGSPPTATPPAGRRGLPSGALRVEPAVILDPTGFEAPMAAVTLFLPTGWTTKGGVVWGQQFACVNGYNFDWSASSPDGRSRIAILPQEKWEWNNYGAGPSSPGCSLAQCTSVEQFLRGSVSQRIPQARNHQFLRRTDLEKDYAQYNRVTPMPLGETRGWVEAGELRYEWIDGGQPMKGSTAAVVVFSLLRTNAGGGLGVMDALTGMAFPGYVTSAPADRFDPAFFEAIRRSSKGTPAWQARIAGHNTAIARVALEEGRKRSAIIARTNEEISRIRQEAWSSYQESADRRFREFGEVIKGVETYDDGHAPGGRVELSSQYNHAWRLNDGSYILTNDTSFEPWRDLGQEGTKLEATK